MAAGAVVTFDFAAFIARYPEFATLDPSLAQLYFNEATLYWRNDGSGPVADTAMQSMLLNMLTAHVAKLNSNAATQAGLVGRIDQATEGSVSVHATMGNQPPSAEWFNQTQYGATFWSATRQFRMAHYRARPTFVPGRGPWWGGGGMW